MNIGRIPLTNPAAANIWSWLARHYWIWACVILGLAVLVETLSNGPDVTHWDTMFVSGALTFTLGLGIAQQMQGRTAEMLTRLSNRGVLKGTPDALGKLKPQLEKNGDRWANIAGIVVAVSLLIAFLLAFGWAALMDQRLFTLACMACGYVAGRFLGRAASLTRLLWLFKQPNISLVVKPAHLDGAAGLKPIGDLLFFQAMLLAIPAAFLGIWWVILPLVKNLNAYYAGIYVWRDPYLVLLSIVLVFELLAFIVPLWSFHLEMLRQKRELQKTADSLSQDVVAKQVALADTSVEHDHKKLQDQIAGMTERYRAIEQMPIWPVDPETRKWFTLNNMALFIPVFSQLTDVSGVWTILLQALTALVPALTHPRL